jgi:hypothetical protein
VINQLFDDLRFFQPSVPLTRNLVSAIQTAHSADLERVRNDERQVEQDEDVPEDSGFEARELSPNSSISELELDDETHFQRRQIAVELYGLLAFQAHSPQARAGRAISIQDSITSGMSVSLGLPKENVLLSVLANEFGRWLRDEGEFLAGWGRIIFAATEHLYLEAFPFEEDKADESEEELANAVNV